MNDPNDVRERLAAMGEVAAEIAHELRNVLQVVATSAYLARQESIKARVATDHIDKVEMHTRIAQGIVDDLMTLARGDVLRREQTKVVELLGLARRDFPEKAASWVDTTNDVVVSVHAGLLARLLHTLYENAIAVCAPRPPKIETHVMLSGNVATFEIKDDGPGVPESIRPRLFEPLSTARAGGTGLGLALARRIAVAHGGSIDLVDSPAGARFRVVIPAA